MHDDGRQAFRLDGFSIAQRKEVQKMEMKKVNEALLVSCPEGFHVMTEEERGKLKMLTDGPGICLSDPERHIMISVGYRGIGFFANLISPREPSPFHSF